MNFCKPLLQLLLATWQEAGMTSCYHAKKDNEANQNS